MTREYKINIITDWLAEFFHSGVFLYSSFVMLSYMVLAVTSIREARKYKKSNRFSDYKSILNSPFAPSVSLIAPAYNEGATIIENVKSLMSIYYAHFEVLIVNDGSRDDTLDKLIEEYDLEKVDFSVDYKIETKNVRGVYKSKKPSLSALTVVDKENGGKADALNVGVNISSFDYIVCIDVDCVLEQDSILKLMKPFLTNADERVIATGGVIRVANSCEIKDGKLVDVKVPKNWIARIQVLEYFRAFLLGRIAWNKIDGLLLISGALGVFDKEIAIKAGGYNHNTVGEDMELVVRMRKYMSDRNLPYRVEFIPDPLCWTEVPEDFNILGRQRNRWTRGTIETLLMHKDMFLKKKYGVIGMVSMPYWFIFEWLAPLVEASGLLLFLVLAVLGGVNWPFALGLILLVYIFAFCFSVLALLIEELTYHQYRNKMDVFRFLLVALFEPLLYHPFMVYSALRGNLDYINGKSSWGEMTRKGFKKKD